MKIDGFHLKEVGVVGNVYDADVLINFAHAKGLVVYVRQRPLNFWSTC